METAFEHQIYNIFGTTDIQKLREISKDAVRYRQLAQKEALRHAAGRKPAFTMPQVIQMVAMQATGKKRYGDRTNFSGQSADRVQSDRPRSPLQQ